MKRLLWIFMFITILLLCGCNNKQSMLPKKMPNDFSFTIKWSFDGTYDSNTNILLNGYNYDLNTECKTELVLSTVQLKEIYTICKKNKVDIYNGTINTKEYEVVPNCDLILTIHANSQEYKITLHNSYLSDNFDEYINGKEVANTIKEIAGKYILSSNEYKSLPPNQQLYD